MSPFLMESLYPGIYSWSFSDLKGPRLDGPYFVDVEGNENYQVEKTIYHIKSNGRIVRVSLIGATVEL